MSQNFSYKPELEANERRMIDFGIGIRLFYVVTIVWIVQKSLYLQTIFSRKEAFSMALHWFGWLHQWLDLPETGYKLLGIIGIFICVYTVVKQKNNVVLQTSLLFILMMFNTLKLSLGYLEHVDHLFLLAHFYLISYKSRKLNALYVKYFQFGLLFTYTLSGFLKLGAMVYKFALTDEITWLHAKALYYQTYLFHEEMHKRIPSWLEQFLSLGILPMLTILLGIVIEAFAVFFVFRYKLIRYYLFWLVAFHTLNYVLFNINFLYAVLTAICFLFPYSIFQQKHVRY